MIKAKVLISDNLPIVTFESEIKSENLKVEIINAITTKVSTLSSILPYTLNFGIDVKKKEIKLLEKSKPIEEIPVNFTNLNSYILEILNKKAPDRLNSCFDLHKYKNKFYFRDLTIREFGEDLSLEYFPDFITFWNKDVKKIQETFQENQKEGIYYECYGFSYEEGKDVSIVYKIQTVKN